MGGCGAYGRVVEIKGGSHRLLSVHCHGSVTINNTKCPLSLSADTSSWCFSPHRLPVFDNKIEPAAFMLTVTRGEHSAGCIALVSTIKTKFPLQTPDVHFFKGSDQRWRAKVKP